MRSWCHGDRPELVVTARPSGMEYFVEHSRHSGSEHEPRTSLEGLVHATRSAYAALRASRISFACRRPRFLSAKMAGRCWARGCALPSSQL